MILRAPAKINWALNILGTRQDGYHEMDILMQSISLWDELELLHAPPGEILFDGDGDNLVVKAAVALMDDNHGVEIWLHKNIPARAGLGGGSADAAAVLLGLNEMWGLGLSGEQLQRIGLTLGADVPFCLTQAPARAQGLGEILTPMGDVPSAELLILHPGCGLSTPAMFRAWDEEGAHTQPADIPASAGCLRRGDFQGLRDCARNMLIACAVRALPEIDEAIAALYRAGAVFAAMSGSGSAVFGVFETGAAADIAALSLPGALRAKTLGGR